MAKRVIVLDETLGPVHMGRVCRFVCKSFDVAYELCEHSCICHNASYCLCGAFSKVLRVLCEQGPRPRSSAVRHCSQAAPFVLTTALLVAARLC